MRKTFLNFLENKEENKTSKIFVYRVPMERLNFYFCSQMKYELFQLEIGKISNLKGFNRKNK